MKTCSPIKRFRCVRRSAAGEAAPADGVGDPLDSKAVESQPANSIAPTAIEPISLNIRTGLACFGLARMAAEPVRMTPEWLMFDGSSAIFRAFYGVPQTFKAPDGFLVNAVRGTLDRLASVITDRKRRHVALTTDEAWRPDWRAERNTGSQVPTGGGAVGVECIRLVPCYTARSGTGV